MADSNTAQSADHDLTNAVVLEGLVVHGQQLGRRLGYPTANLQLPDAATISLPSPGVYAAWAWLEDGSRRIAMVNIGYRPTVSNERHVLSIEAHIDDFEGDLYDQRIRLTFVKRIRDERRMNSLDELRQQLATDLSVVRHTLVVDHSAPV